MRWCWAVGWMATACSDKPSAPDGCGTGDVCIIAGTGDLGFNGDGHSARDTRLASPSAVYEDPSGLIAVVDYSNMRVRQVSNTGTVSTVVGNGFHAYSEDEASALDTPLENPIDIAWSAGGDLCVLPQHEGRVICLDEGGHVYRYAGTGVIADSGDGGDAIDAEMGYGGAMVFTEDGTLFISDSTFSRIRQVQPDGTIDTVLGTGQAGTGANGFGPEMAIRFPVGLAYDTATQRLIVADTHNHRIVSLDTLTLEAEVVAGSGEPGFDGDEGPATDAKLHLPSGVAIGPNGGLLIADSRNHVVRHVNANGTINTVVGTGEPDLSLTHASHLSMPVVGPAGLSWTASGDLLIAEQFGHRILNARGLYDEL